MFTEETKTHQRGTWEVRKLSEDVWSWGDNQSDLKEGKRGIPILVFSMVLQKKVLNLDMSLLYSREENSISKCFSSKKRYRDVVFSMPKIIVFEN